MYIYIYIYIYIWRDIAQIQETRVKRTLHHPLFRISSPKTTRVLSLTSIDSRPQNGKNDVCTWEKRDKQTSARRNRWERDEVVGTSFSLGGGEVTAVIIIIIISSSIIAIIIIHMIFIQGVRQP